jgi:NADPH-dependent F420 reductase
MILPRVIADERERQSGVPEKLSKLDVRVYYSQLAVGDYVVNPEIAAERKSLGDFVSSVYDGRLFAQASALAASYRKPYIIVEGDVNKLSGMVKNLASYYGAVASVTLAYDLRLMHTANSDETAQAIAALVRNSRAKPIPPGLLQAPPKSKDEAQQQLYFVSALPGVGIKLAKRMLGRYGTPRKVVSLTESQFAMIPGVGAKRASKIAHVLDTRHPGWQQEDGAQQGKLEAQEAEENRRMSNPGESKIAVIGGTGDLGFGLAVRLAKAYAVTIGSRDLSRAADAAARAETAARVRVEAKTNEEAASGCDIAILAVPDLPTADFLSSLAQGLREKLVISPIVPMLLKGGVFSLSLSGESAAERVAEALPSSRVAGAFHTVPAPRLAQLGEELAYDVLVTAGSRAVYDEAARVVSSVGRLRPLYAGPLTVSRLVEGMTPALLNVSKLNKLKSPSIRLV